MVPEWPNCRAPGAAKAIFLCTSTTIIGGVMASFARPREQANHYDNNNELQHRLAHIADLDMSEAIARPRRRIAEPRPRIVHPRPDDRRSHGGPRERREK